ncbi:hypothetical protein PZ938_03195 [Luteipulveratus sp. YIM 133132]|uniref:Htaa domain-containing protein n=1 Tax=Luteipulveratus flavus TaxID=3031728 RepID=A0ABT6CA13_9MICO|nr:MULTISPECIES: hypothetical protein [unclassified Luteipulveratus]MDE9364599.1 hypothetical protein [Luteipulveratus sp. YIM 133132]MDF8265740.1 hypothetical protein [Luteipulveratus sp. YIM 133296]
MKRNTALFGASVAAGVAGAIGLVVASAGGVAAPKDPVGGGVAWRTITDNHPTFASGSVGDSDGFFTARASTTGGVSDESTSAEGIVTRFSMPALGVSGIGVTVGCDGGAYTVTVTGGGAPGKKALGSTTSLAAFTGNANAQGTVTFGRGGADGRVGAYLDLADAIGEGTYIKLGYASCAAGPTPTGSPTSTPTQPPTSTSSPTPSPTGTTTGTGTSTGTPTGTFTGTGTPTGTSTQPPTGTSSPTQEPTGPTPTGEPTEPPVPTPSTTALPVTG